MNYAVPDEEFSITVPKGGRIQDEREGGRDYRATEEARLFFNEKLNLDKIPALEATRPPRPKKSQPTFAKPQFGLLATGIIAVLACALPLALVAFVLIVRKISKPRVIEAEMVDR